MKKYISNRFVRIGVYLAIFLLIIFFTLQWLLAYRAKDILENLVSSQTHGKVDVRIGKVNLKLFPATRLDLLDTRIYFFDRTGKTKAYEVNFTYLGLQLHSLKDFILHKKLEVDFLVAENPHVQIFPAFRKTEQKGNKEVHFEIGSIYIALQKIAKQMHVKRFGLLNGKITLLKLQPNQTTISIGGVNFTARDLAVTKSPSNLVEEQLQAGQMRLNTGKQEVSFPDGNFTVSYSSLHLDTEEKLVAIDGFSFTGKAKDTSLGMIEAGFAQFRMYNLDFWSLYNDGLIKIDSLICIDPKIKMGIDVSPVPGQRSTDDISIEKKIAGITGKLNIKYIALRNSSFSITTKGNGRISSFYSTGNDFEAQQLLFDSAAAKPLDIGKVSFAIKNYTASSADSLYNMKFDSVIFANKSISLINFRIEPSARNKHKDLKWLSVPQFQLNNISIAHLLSEKKIKADELVLKNALLVNNFIPKTDQKQRPKPIREIITQIHAAVDLNKIRVENTALIFQSVVNKNQRTTVSGLNSEISPEAFFDGSTYELMGYSIGHVRFDSLHMRNGAYNLNMSDGEIKGKDKTITAKHINIDNPTLGTRIHARDFKLYNYHFDDNFKEISVDSISYSYASLHIRPDNKKSEASNTSESNTPNLKLGHFKAKDIKLDYQSGDSIQINTHVNYIEANGFSLIDGKINITGFDMDITGLALSTPQLNTTTGPILIHDSRASSIQDIRLQYAKNSNNIKAYIPQINFVPSISQSLKLKYPVIPQIILEKPQVEVSLNQTGQTGNDKKEQGSIDLGLIKISQGNISIHTQNGNKSLNFEAAALNFTSRDIKTNIENDLYSVGKTEINTDKFDLRLNDTTRVFINNGQFQMELDRLRKGRDVDSGQFNAQLKSLNARGLHFHSMSKKGKPVEINGFTVGAEVLAIDSLDKGHILRRIKANPSLHASDITLRKVDDKNSIEAFGIGFTNGNKTITVDSFNYHPLIDRDSFNRTLQWQKDYLQVKTGKIAIRNFDIEKIASDSLYYIGFIEVNDPDLSVYKDKRLPFQHDIIKALPVDMFRKIDKRIHIDSIRLYDGHLVYEEFNDKTNSIGKVNFTHIQARIRNIKNYDYKATDSLKLGVTTKFLDEANLGLRFHESYTDTLSAFLMQVRIGKFDLTKLNPVIGPLASAKIDKGFLDTLELKAIGREYLAHGKMKMLYRDLKIEFLNKGDEDKKTIMTRFITWVANGIVKGKNTKKTGTVFTRRVRERSVFNYWIKIVLSGALTNSGIKTNSKQEKKYKKSVRKLNVPEIPDVDL